MNSLPEGTLLEVSVAKGISQVFVVTRERPIELRLATPWERFRFQWRGTRVKVGDMAAACDAVYAIEHAMGVRA